MHDKIDWLGLGCTLALIISVREAAVWLMTRLDNPELGNLFGLFSLLVLLIVWRKLGSLPRRMLDNNARIMKESAFAFLPISAGAVLMLSSLGHELLAMMIIIVVATLLPMWLYAKLAKRWL
jgi:putative effector of murein hydrolase LrgA (UPF0299 family)